MPRATFIEALRFSGYRWTVDFLQVVLLWADTLILGAFYPPQVAGVYSVSSRIVVFLSVGITALNLVIAPFVARALHGNDNIELSDAFSSAARWCCILTLVPLGIVLPLRHEILGVFGDAFVVGATPLAILSVGFGFNAACGPAGVILNMSAMSRVVLFDNVLAVALNIGLNLGLIPLWGMTGAAIAWSSSLVMMNVLMLAQLHRLLHVDVLRGPVIRTAAALGFVALAAFLAGNAHPVLGLGVASVGFSVAVLVTREPGERAVLHSVVATVRRRKDG
jgi:O-antigen/teichoic acid export membrane protein